MKIIFYSTKKIERDYFEKFCPSKHQIHFIKDNLSYKTLAKAKDYDGVCCFVTDCLDEQVVKGLAMEGIKLIALRSAGYDHVDLVSAKVHNINVVRVPSYSPQAIAEFAVGLILTLSRKIVNAYVQGLKYNFAHDQLIGFNLYQKTVGIIGTGNIGTAFAKIMQGFGCRLLANDPAPNAACEKLGVNYVSLTQLLQESDIVSLHCILNRDTHHILDSQEFLLMKKNSMLINTGRGALINTTALLNALLSGQLGYAGLDVYEKEQGIFFIDHQGKTIKDEQFLQLQALPNVIITPHQAYLTTESIANIAKITIDNITAFEQGKLINQL